MIVKPPTYPLLAVAFAAPAGTDFSNLSAINPALYTVTVMTTEPTPSASPQPENIGLWTSGVGTPVAGLVSDFLPSTQPLRWRTTARSSTEYLVASDLSNQGTVTSGQYAARIASYRPWNIVGASLTNCAAWNWQLAELPLDEENMTVMNPKVRVAPAKQGVYQPMYSIGPTFEWAFAGPKTSVFGQVNGAGALGSYPWASVQNSPGSVSDRAVAAIPSLVTFVDPTFNYTNDAWISQIGVAPNISTGLLGPGVPYTWGFDNTMTGISLYRGLSQSASITVKMVLGVEIIPSPTSPIRQFAVPSAANEPLALQLYYDLISSMPQTYPSSANFMSAVIAAASYLLPMILPHVPRIIGAIKSVVAPSQASQPEMAAASTSRPAIRAPSRASSVRSRVSIRSGTRAKARVKAPKKKR